MKLLTSLSTWNNLRTKLPCSCLAAEEGGGGGGGKVVEVEGRGIYSGGRNLCITVSKSIMETIQENNSSLGAQCISM